MSSVVLLLVPLLGPLVAPLLGGLALVRIRESNGRLRGRRLALGGIVLGGLLLLAQAWGLDRLMTHITRDVDARVRSGVAAVLAMEDGAEGGHGERVSAMRYWSGRSGELVDAARIEAFAEEARTRYGPLRSLSTLSGDRASGLGGQVVTFALAFRFERGDRLGSATTRLEPSTVEIMPSVRLIEITIEDAAAGDLTLTARGKESADGGR